MVDTSFPNVEKTGLSSYPPLPTQASTPAGNTPSISLYSNVTGKSSRKALNFCTLFTSEGNEVDVIVRVKSIRAISERKLEKLIIDEKVALVDDDGKPLKRVNYTGDHDSEDKVESVDSDMARSMASESVGLCTKSLLEQCRDSYDSGEYNEDPYDDDMYKGQDFHNKIQDTCDNLDIRV
nr:hypothetical protein [Tanacetum cinerariifolium]